MVGARTHPRRHSRHHDARHDLRRHQRLLRAARPRDRERRSGSRRERLRAEQFLQHPEQVLSREQLLSRVWGFDFDPGSNVVDVYVRYLRGKFGAERIETVRGMGYRLV